MSHTIDFVTASSKMFIKECTSIMAGVGRKSKRKGGFLSTFGGSQLSVRGRDRFSRDSHEWRSVEQHVWPSIGHGPVAVMDSVYGRTGLLSAPSGLDVLDWGDWRSLPAGHGRSGPSRTREDDPGRMGRAIGVRTRNHI
jgi:hypothetical protein